jgi:hypothetical protein
MRWTLSRMRNYTSRFLMEMTFPYGNSKWKPLCSQEDALIGLWPVASAG